MIIVSTDNSKIYQLLETAGHLPLDFSFNKVMLFDHKDDCYAIIFDASLRNFSMFKAPAYRQDVNALPDLLAAIQGYETSVLPDGMQEQAVRLIEDKLHSKDNTRFYFDAH